MKSPLLQQPLPVMRKQLPAIHVTKASGNQAYMLAVDGIGEAPIPKAVAEAIEELEQHGLWAEMGYHCIGKMGQPGIVPRPDIAVLALMLRHSELNYVAPVRP